MRSSFILDYVARAPPKKEVEDLTPKEIMRCLREKVQAGNQQAIVRPMAPPQPQFIVQAVDTLRETLEAIIFDEKGAEINRIPVSELAEKLKGSKETHAVVFDGIITQRLLDIAEEKKISIVGGDRISNIAKKPVDLKILTLSDIR